MAKIDTGKRLNFDIILVVALMFSAILSTHLWHSAAQAREAEPQKVLTIPPGTRRPTHTAVPFDSVTATVTAIATMTPTAVATAMPTIFVPTLVPTTTTATPTVDDETDEAVQVGLKVKRVCVAENSGTIAIGLTLNQPSEEIIIVDVVSKPDGSELVANAGQDFEFINDSVTFSNGQQDALINLSVSNDAIEEGDETLLLEIQGTRNSNVTIDPAAQSAEIIILDDDDQNEETSQHNCEQMYGQLASGFDIQTDEDNSSFSVNGVVIFEITIHNPESYTLTDALLDVTIPAGMTLVVEEGSDAVAESISEDDTGWDPIDTTWQIDSLTNTAASDGFAGEAQIQMRLGDIRPGTEITLRLLLRISQEIAFDSATIVTGRLSAIHPDSGQNRVRDASSKISLTPTQLPPEVEPAMKLFLPIVNG